MNFKIRQMHKEDISSILQIEKIAFGVAASREPLYLLKQLELLSNGCFVSTVNNKIIGFVFSHLNGPVGWISLLAIHPEFQNQTIGKTLFLEALDFLLSKSEIVGLQLPADSSKLSSFLIKSDFQFVEPQIVLSAKVSNLKKINNSLPDLPIEWEDIFRIEQFIEQVADCNLISSVNLKKADFNYGTFVIETKPRRIIPNSIGIVSVGGCLRNLSCSPIACGLKLIAEKSECLDFDEIYFALNSFYSREIKWLCNNGCKIRKVVQRLVNTKSVSRYKQLLSRPQIDLTNWSI